MPKYPTMSKEDKKWQADCDACTLAEAEEIKADKERLEAAEKAAAQKAKDKAEEAERLARVAGGKMTYSTMPDKEK